MIILIFFYIKLKNLTNIIYPMLSFLSSGVQSKFGAITIAKFWGLILLRSWCLVSKAKNLIIYLRLFKLDWGNFCTTLRIACNLLSWVCNLKNWSRISNILSKKKFWVSIYFAAAIHSSYKWWVKSGSGNCLK